MTSAQGIDVSAYQNVYTPRQLAAYSFAFFRAAVGDAEVDGNFAANWANAKTAGVHRGAYLELEPASDSSAAQQAACFSAVIAAQGVEPGDMIAVVCSDYSGVTDAEVKAVLDTLAAWFPASPVFLYSDTSELGNWDECTAYPLWVAAYQDSAPAPVAPWSSWTLWQYQGTTAPDNDAFNGDAAQLQAFLGTYASGYILGPVQGLAAADATADSVRLSWGAPVTVSPAVGSYQLTIRNHDADLSGYPQTVTGRAGTFGGLPPGAELEAMVRAVAAGGGHASEWATAGFETPAA